LTFHQAQKTIFEDNSRFKVVCSGRRFGKTYLCISEILFYALNNPGSKIVYYAPTISQARDIVWKELKNKTHDFWVTTPNETRMEIKIKTKEGVDDLTGATTLSDKNPSEIWLRGTENIESARGNKINFLVVDEVASIRNWEYVWNTVLRPTLTDTVGKAIFISTPKGFNHFYTMYNRHLADTDYSSFHYSTYDNPHIPKEEVDKARKEVTEEQFRQEYMAEFVAVSGQVYKEWDMTRQFIPVQYNPELELHVTFDFGVNDPTAIIWIQKQGNFFHIIDYYEMNNASVEHFVHILNSKPYKKPTLYTGDPAGRARNNVTGTSVLTEYAKNGIHIRTIPGVRIEEQIRITHKYIAGLYVSDSLTRVRDCILNYRYPDKENVLNSSNEDPVHDEYSHFNRALEYYFVNIDNGLANSTKREFIPQNLFRGWNLE
jgi:hypothetical protein